MKTKQAEPILIKAGDMRVKLGYNSNPPVHDCRVVAEDYYQRMIKKIELSDELLGGLRLVLTDVEWMKNSPTQKYIKKLIKNCK